MNIICHPLVTTIFASKLKLKTGRLEKHSFILSFERVTFSGGPFGKGINQDNWSGFMNTGKQAKHIQTKLDLICFSMP